MKRKDAFRKVRTVCQRLDDRDLGQFPIVPLQLCLFGSLLADNPDPRDIDLLLRYKEWLPVDDLLRRLDDGRDTFDEAVATLRRGMQMLRFEWMDEDTSVERWLAERLFTADTPMVLVWQEGLDWAPIVDEIEANPPAVWDPDLAAWRKQVQAEARQISKEQGKREALAWLKEQKYGGRGE